MIVVCYDGSADARAALEWAASAFGARELVVLTVWEGLTEVLALTRSGHGVSALDVAEVDRDSEARALAVATEGAALAAARGAEARPLVRKRTDRTWQALLDAADELAADAIVLGTRGQGPAKSLLGSVSHAVLQHASRPVAVVPSPRPARRSWRHPRSTLSAAGS